MVLPPNLSTNFAAPIGGDLPCRRCSYNLRGLKKGDRCPECGTPITGGPSSRVGWLLTDAPLDYLSRFARGCVLMLFGAAVLVTAWAWTILKLSFSGVFSTPAAFGGIIGGIAWAVGVFTVTAPRPPGPERTDTHAEWHWLRATNRVLQCGWALGFAFLLPVALSPTPANMAMNLIAGGLLLFTAFVGLAPLAIHLARFADWANDASLAQRLRMAPLALLISAILGIVGALTAPFLASALFRMIGAPALVVGGGIFVFCAAQFGIALFQFASMGYWALATGAHTAKVDRRRSARIVKRIDGAQAKPGTTPVHAPQGHKPAKPQGNYIPAPPEPAPIDLAPPPEGTAGL
jgi:hypothetical protein